MAKRTNDEDDDDRDDLEDEGDADSRDDASDDAEPKKPATKGSGKSAPSKAAAAADSDESDSDESDSDESDSDESDSDESDSDESDSDESDSDESAEENASTDGDDAGKSDDDEETLPAQLGVQRYVYAAAFGSMILGAYVLSKALDGLWQYAASKDFVVLRAPWIAAVSDDSKANYSLVIGGVLAFAILLRWYRRPTFRAWSDEVTTELVKVKWPTRKEVFNSTTVVLTTTAVAVVYLFLLDRFWGFVTNLIYGGT
jgi:preprotein translocase subunit SecE